MELAERIQFTVRRSGKSRRALCLAAGLSHSYLTFVLSSLKTSPGEAPFNMEHLRAVARAAGVSPTWLLTGAGSPEDPEVPEVPAPSLDAAFVARPRFASLPDWPELLERSRELAPQLPAWVWERLAETAPLLSAPPTPVMVAELATWMHRHERVYRPSTGVRKTT